MIKIKINCSCGYTESWQFPNNMLSNNGYIEDGIREDLEDSGWQTVGDELLCRDCVMEEGGDPCGSQDFSGLRSQISTTQTLDRLERSGG